MKTKTQPRLDEWSDLSLADIRSRAREESSNEIEALERAIEQMDPDKIDSEGVIEFVKRHPEWPATPLNGQLLITWLEERDVPATVNNCEIAWRELAAGGWLEKKPKVKPVAAPSYRGLVRKADDGVDFVEEDSNTDGEWPVIQHNSDGSSESIDLEAEVKRLESIARSPVATDAQRKDADAKIKLLVRTQLAKSRSPRLHEQKWHG